MHYYIFVIVFQNVINTRIQSLQLLHANYAIFKTINSQFTMLQFTLKLSLKHALGYICKEYIYLKY